MGKKIFCVKKNLGKKFWVKEIWGKKKIWVLVNKNVELKNFRVNKTFGSTKNMGQQKFLGPTNILRQQKFRVQQNFGSKQKFWVQKIL